MYAIVCVDSDGGTFFNGRRQSMDRKARTFLLGVARRSKLWVKPYTAGQFTSQEQASLHVSETYLEDAGPREFCFVEGDPLEPVLDRVEALFLLCWNRKYPSDQKLDVPLEKWSMVQRDEFAGSSHDKITLEVYVP